MTEEIWLPVPSVPGLVASSLGRVMVVPHEKPMPYGGVRKYGGTPRYGCWAEDCSRFIIRLRGRTYKVHQLVCEAFNGPKPFPKAVVMHDDENPRNNVPGNLKWGTQKENLNYPGFLEKNRLHRLKNIEARKTAIR